MRIAKMLTIAASTCALLLAMAWTSTVTAQDPALTPVEELGKAIFFDTALSINGNQACATCHGLDAGWTGPDVAVNLHGAVYEGSVPGQFGARKPLSAAYATFSPI
ncbi:MAG: cytochrome-c peroxidase, partial [Caldilineaceae bacterium]|nr:cytochrome-c peroxidase [Caldilineaceae bacterium]